MSKPRNINAVWTPNLPLRELRYTCGIATYSGTYHRIGSYTIPPLSSLRCIKCLFCSAHHFLQLMDGLHGAAAIHPCMRGSPPIILTEHEKKIQGNDMRSPIFQTTNVHAFHIIYTHLYIYTYMHAFALFELWT